MMKMNNKYNYHIPVLLNSSIEGLNINPNGMYVDVTFGGGGHSQEILNQLSENGKLFAFDQDLDALNNAIDDPRFTLINQNFKHIKNYLHFYGIEKVDGILADLGVSSYQFDKKDRGFSIRQDANLDMRMNQDQTLSAKEVVNTYSYEELISIFYQYGELKNAKQIANKIIKVRNENEISTTAQLINAIKFLSKRNKENQFLAQVFQAVRIEVNNELDALKVLLQNSVELFKPKGRLVVISYHSLEDRLVKNFLKKGKFKGELEKDFFGNPITPFKIINNKVLVPTNNEIELNSRARSAKLRIAERICNE